MIVVDYSWVFKLVHRNRLNLRHHLCGFHFFLFVLFDVEELILEIRGNCASVPIFFLTFNCGVSDI